MSTRNGTGLEEKGCWDSRTGAWGSIIILQGFLMLSLSKLPPEQKTLHGLKSSPPLEYFQFPARFSLNAISCFLALNSIPVKGGLSFPARFTSSKPNGDVPPASLSRQETTSIPLPPSPALHENALLFKEWRRREHILQFSSSELSPQSLS